MREDALVTVVAFSEWKELARLGVPIIAFLASVTAVLQEVEADWSVGFSRRTFSNLGWVSSASR